MSSDNTKESKSLNVSTKLCAKVKPIKISKCGCINCVESFCSDGGLAGKTQSSNASGFKEFGLLKPQDAQINMKRKLEELHTSFFSNQDSNTISCSKEVLTGHTSQKKSCKYSSKINLSCGSKSKNLGEFLENKSEKSHVSATTVQEQSSKSILSKKPISCIPQSQYQSVSKIQHSFNASPQNTDECLRIFSSQDYHSSNSSGRHVEHSSTVNYFQEEHCGSYSSSCPVSQDPENVSKKQKIYHSSKLSDQKFQSSSFALENQASNSSAHSSCIEHSIKTCSKPQSVHSRFKKEFDQLESSFLPTQECSSASSTKNNSSSLSLTQNVGKLLQKNTFKSCSQDILKPVKSKNLKSSVTESPPVETCVHGLCVQGIQTDPASRTSIEKNAHHNITAEERFPIQLISKLTKAECSDIAELAEILCADVSVVSNVARGDNANDEQVCPRENFIATKCKKSHNFKLNLEANTVHSNQGCAPVCILERTSSPMKIPINTKTQKRDTFFEQVSSLNAQQDKNENDLTPGSELKSSSGECKAVHLSTKKPTKLETIQKISDSELSLKPVLADTKCHSELLPKENKVTDPTVTKSLNTQRPCNNPVSDPSFSVLKKSNILRRTEDQYENLQETNVDLSLDKCEVIELKKCITDPKDREWSNNEQDLKVPSHPLVKFSFDSEENFVPQPGASSEQQIRKENIPGSRKNVPWELEKSNNLQPCNSQHDPFLESKPKPTSTEEIPFLTIKKPGPVNRTSNDRTVVKLFIADLLRLTPSSRKNYYTFYDLVVHRVDLFGTVVGVRPVGHDKIIYEVDDGTGTITCMHQTTKLEAKLNYLKAFLNDKSNNEIFISQAESSFTNEFFSEEIAEQESAYSHIRAHIENCLAVSDEEQRYDIGNTVIAKGVLYNYRDAISFYVYSIRKVKNVAEEIDRHFQMAVLYRSVYPKTVKGFKT